MVLTDHDDKGIALAAIRHGAQDYLPKSRLSAELLQRTVGYAAERAHLADELHLRDEAVRASRTGVVITDMRLPDEPLIYANPAFSQITGYRPDEVLGRNCRFLQGEGADPRVVDSIRAALNRGENIQVVIRNYRKSGELFWNELIMSPVHDSSGKATHFVGIQNDVSDRVEAELALQQAKDTLELRVAERTSELREALDVAARTREEALMIVGLTLEYRDYETKGHTERVTSLAQEVGSALGLDDEQLASLRWGSYLHDTGKIAIPDNILLKPGKLTEGEYERIKSHVISGEKMLRQLSFLPEEVFAVVRHHHERWDGSGYPDGLEGEDIPLPARLFSVVDIYDALTSKRPYKEAWSHEDAMTEIEKQRGAQFDPAVVDCFVGTCNGFAERVARENVSAFAD